jgi:hypothetical protein
MKKQVPQSIGMNVESLSLTNRGQLRIERGELSLEHSQELSEDRGRAFGVKRA